MTRSSARQTSALEQRVLEVHRRRPGFTARGFATSGSYDRLAALVPCGARTLDLACGDGTLLALLPAGAIGLDLSAHELALACSRNRSCVVRARAQALPFANDAFDAVTCHLAFMLFHDIETVAREIDRVLAPGGTFIAMLGGGPVAEPAPDDVFPIFLELLATQAAPSVIADPRARTEAGWRALFAGWNAPPWERDELVLDGSFEEVWSFLAASYELPRDPEPLRAELARRVRDPIRCRAVTWLARATKPS